MTKSIFTLFAVILTISISYGQTDCKDELLSIFQKMRKAEGMEQAHVKYVMNVYDQQNILSNDTVDIYTSPKRSRVVTHHNEIFQDETVILSMLNQEKMVYVMDPIDGEAGSDSFKNGAMIQDSIIIRSQIIDCSTICLDDENDKNENNYMLKVDEDIADYFGYDKISILTDGDRRMIKRIELIYQKGLSPSRMVIDILKYDTEYTQDIFEDKNPHTILASLEKNSGGYEIIDLREADKD